MSQKSPKQWKDKESLSKLSFCGSVVSFTKEERKACEEIEQKKRD
jgi:hypothetical protein